MTPKAQTTTTKIDTLNFIKMKNFCASKDTTKKGKRQPRNGRKYLQVMCLMRNGHPDYIKNYFTSTIKTKITQLKNKQRTGLDISLKKTYRWPMNM